MTQPEGAGERRASAARDLARTVATGRFVNTMWGEGGSGLARVQMGLIRVLLIWPLKAVAPAAYLFWLRRLWRSLLADAPPSRSVAGLRGPAALLRAVALWGAGEALSLWLGVEAIFFLFYHYQRWRLQERATPPTLRPGETLEMLRRIFEATRDIQASGRLLDGVSSVRLSPALTPKASVQDLGQLLMPKTTESNVEELLREWDALPSSPPLEVPPAMSPQERAVVERLVDDAEMMALKRAEITGWFLRRCKGELQRLPAGRGGEIRRGNLAEWMAWAFFHQEPGEVPEARRPELEQLVEESVRWAGMEFPPGYNPQVRSMRLTLDPIPSEHRPLIYYIVTALALPIVNNRQLENLGFCRHRSGTLSYWRRPGAGGGPEAAPIVFCHGIGVNLLPYTAFISEILQYAPERSLFLVSLPHISMRIKEDVPSSAEMVACLSDMLASWDAPCAHFIGHSFGSLLVAWMCKRAPDRVSMATFIDPVCFLLIKPDVCYNFMYRQPQTPTQLLMYYFVARELYIAHSLSRNFFWYQNIVWPEELGSMPALVALSGKDSIVPAHSVRRFLMAYKQRHKDKASTLRVVWFPEMGHGEINFGPDGLAASKNIVKEMLLMEGACQVVPRRGEDAAA